MAIIREYYGKGLNDVDLYRTYSDQEFMIRKVGTDEVYEDAIDSEYFEYEETDIKIGAEEQMNELYVEEDITM